VARTLKVALVALGLAVLVACSNGDDDEAPAPQPEVEVRLNQIQVLGSHNSYHVQPAPSVMEPLRTFNRALADSIEYTHTTLSRQLEREGVRNLEIDVWADPQGGLFLNRTVPAFLNVRGATGPDDLREPGFKVFHIQDLDFRSTCWTLFSCLAEVNEWSDTYPDHLPVVVLIEVKEEPIVNAEAEALGLTFTAPKRIERGDVDALDDEIRAVVPADKLLTPDDVRGSRPTLQEAVRDGAWPTIDDMRGKLVFALINGGHVRDVYVEGHGSLQGRVMFANSEAGTPYASFFNIDDPVADGARITRLVHQGYLVRTRADADTREARTGDTTRRDAAFRSGAHIVATDYATPDRQFGHQYVARLPGGNIARCNPVNGPPDCRPSLLAEER
jgi:hypothetical protein